MRPTNVRYDPGVYAVTPKGVGEDTTCIAMTRSIGDLYAHQFGMTNLPSITFEELELEEEYTIAVGSDGVWDCWKWADFADFLNGCLAKYDLHNGTVNETSQLFFLISNNFPKTKHTWTNSSLLFSEEAIIQHTIARAKACFGTKS